MTTNQAPAAGHAPPPPAATGLRPAAQAVHVTRTYGHGPAQVRALDDVSAAFPAGRFTAIMGPSGSGKSTLLHCLAGLDRVDAGRVLLGDTDLSRLTDTQLTRVRRDQVGFIFQAFNLLPMLSAYENIVLPMTIAGRRPEPAWLDTVVGAVGLAGRLGHKPAELSGGQQQRVAGARALAGRPTVVFADEPTGNLDSRSGEELLGFMRTSVDELGQTIVMVTHDPVAASFAHAVLFLADGRIVGELPSPTPARVLDRMKALGG